MVSAADASFFNVPVNVRQSILDFPTVDALASMATADVPGSGSTRAHPLCVSLERPRQASANARPPSKLKPLETTVPRNDLDVGHQGLRSQNQID